MASKSRSKSAPKKMSGSKKPVNPLGIGLGFEIPDFDALENEDDSEIDEGDLESELEAIISGKAPTREKRAAAKPKATSVFDIEKLAADCMKDDFEADGDENLSNDEDLLNELHVLTKGQLSLHVESTDKEEHVPKTVIPENKDAIDVNLNQRLAMYNEALKTAKLNNDTAKSRRYGRAIKTLENLIKAKKSGASINIDEIPPEPPKFSKKTEEKTASDTLSMPTQASKDLPVDTFPGQSVTSESDSQQISGVSPTQITPSEDLAARRDEYKRAALNAKKAGNKELAITYLKTSKQIEAMFEAIKNNLPVDLSSIPPPLNELPISVAMDTNLPRQTKEEPQASSDWEKAALEAAENETQQSELFGAPSPPGNVLEALNQRLEKYSSTKKSAESEGNASKARRLQRIVKLYEKAIIDYKAGRPVNYEELPTPPGFAPIPVVNDAKSEEVNKPKTVEILPPKTKENKGTDSGMVQSDKKKPKIQRTTTNNERQLNFILEKQRLFREAALASKRSGDLEQAKIYLKNAKGFDSLIEAIRCGLPVDLSSIPEPPQQQCDFVVVEFADCTENANSDQEQIYDILLTDLSHQFELSTKNKEHFLRLGDVNSAVKFEKLALEAKKDLSVIQHLKNKGESAPKFHYETRLFSIVMCHPDLSESEIEVSIERGIDLPGKPDDLDSYIKLEFPIPQDAIQKARTQVVKDTNNPEYKEAFKFQINRKSRAQLRLFKRQAIKCEVWSKGGFLRSDSLLGTAIVKLVDLESKCLIHDSFNLMDSRKKSCGGKLEVKVRAREPLLAKQIEEIREKWLVIGS